MPRVTSPRRPRLLHEETFTKGPGVWRVGKHDEAGAWHRNCFGQRGTPAPLGWDPRGGPKRKGCAFSEGPWYFDDNHGELFWLFLMCFMNRSADGGLENADFRHATIDLTLRSNGFEPRGTQLYLWIQGRDEVFHNWCLYTQPITRGLESGRWTDERVTLVPDERHWRAMGLLNGGLARRLRVIQSTSSADGTLEPILAGKHVNFGFILGNVDPADQPTGRLEFARIAITAG